MGKGDQRVGHQAGLVPSSARDRASKKLQFELYRPAPNFRWNGRAASAVLTSIVRAGPPFTQDVGLRFKSAGPHELSARLFDRLPSMGRRCY